MSSSEKPTWKNLKISSKAKPALSKNSLIVFEKRLLKILCFHVRQIKVGILGVVCKTKLVGDH